MRNLFIAEVRKAVGNRWSTGFLLWLFPLGALGFNVVQLFVVLVSSSAREFFAGEPALWTEQLISVWSIPSNVLGRILLLGFTALVFAGEYQWGTWKNIAPRNKRTAFILVKFLTVVVLILFAFLLMSFFQGIGRGLVALVAGGEYGPALSGEVFGDFLSDYALQMVLSMTSVLIGAGYVALTAMLMRSIIGGLLVGLGVTVAEPVSLLGLFLLTQVFDQPRLLHLFRSSPFYNLENVRSWILDDAPTQLGQSFATLGSEYAFSDGLAFSLVVLTIWVVGLIVLNILLFQRQDITS